jgi:uncharacterized phage protein gp47/JayE
MAEKTVEYTTKDYLGYRQDMINLIASKLPEWTDHSANDAGIVLLELLAYQLEKLSYYNDRIANEVFLTTATQRKSIINHCKMLGYDLAWHTASRFYQVFELVPQPTTTIIPKGFQVGTVGSNLEDSIIFETVEDLIIPAGKTGLEKDPITKDYLYKVEVEHGQTITDELIGTLETKTPSQQFYLDYSPVLQNSIKIDVMEMGVKKAWTAVSDFISSGTESNEYIKEMDEYDRVFIQLGTGLSGRIPDIGSAIFATYRVGGGIEGNVGSQTIVEFYGSVPGLISTFNPDGPHVLGADKESIESAKVNAPLSLRRLERYVTLDDYENGVLIDCPTIGHAKAVNVEGAVDLYLTNKEGQPLTTAQKQKVAETIEEKKIMFTNVSLLDPNYVQVALNIVITLYDNVIQEDIKYEIENRIMELFDFNNVTFGTEIPLGVIYREIFSVEGVRNVKINSPLQDIIVNETAIPVLQSLAVKVGE